MLPPITTTVTQYTTTLTSAICMTITVWHYTIHNTCQDQILPHPLHNPIRVFHVHNNRHFTTLIINNYTYRYYDSLNLGRLLRPTRYTTLSANGTRDSTSHIHSSDKLHPTSTFKAPLNKPSDGLVAFTCSSST